jgi:hypothetical protein
MLNLLGRGRRTEKKLMHMIELLMKTKQTWTSLYAKKQQGSYDAGKQIFYKNI